MDEFFLKDAENDGNNEEGNKPNSKSKERHKSTNKNQADAEMQLCENILHLKYEEWPNQAEKTAIIFDKRMNLHKCEWDSVHPENPNRLQKINESFIANGIFKHKNCEILEISPEPRKDIMQLYHTESLIGHAEASRTMTVEELKSLSASTDGAYFNNETWQASCLALNATIKLTEEVLNGSVKNGFAAIRPPGHHSMSDEACGYCVFNNVALAATHAVTNLGLQRVLIIDWDIHHGQGTQYAFYDDPRVMYVSIHRFEHQKFWPELRESNYDFVGNGEARGYNINVPLNSTGINNADYLAIFDNLILPISYEFDPELVLVSCGLDAAIGDELGEMKLHPACYAHLTHALMGLADGKLVVCLEGGYCLQSLSASVTCIAQTLLGEPLPPLELFEPLHNSVVQSVLNCITALRPYWSSLALQEVSCIVQRPDLSHLPVNSWAQVKQPEFPDTHSVLDEKVVAADMAALRSIQQRAAITPAHGTCVFYDTGMKAHKTQGHPERPSRIAAIHERLVKCGLWSRCSQLCAEAASRDQLLLLHQDEYIERVKLTSTLSKDELKEEQRRYNSIYLHPSSYDCALLAAGGLLRLVEEVCFGRQRNGFAVVRPPGHHAESGCAMGFCFFNNVALAAKYAQQKFPNTVRKVLILDWDVHHGNGIQHLFYNDASVLYISIHRFDRGMFFPASPDGNFDFVGGGEGRGFNMNVPWNSRTVGDSEFLLAFRSVVMPVARKFAPDLVLVSAGFDSARGDCLGGCQVTPETFAQLTHSLSSLAQGRVLLALEGGYSLRSLADSAAACVSVLLGNSPGRVQVTCPDQDAVISVRNVIRSYREFEFGLGSSLRFLEALPLWKDEWEKEDLEDKMAAASLQDTGHGQMTTLLVGMPEEEMLLLQQLQGSFGGLVAPKASCEHLEAVDSVDDLESPNLDMSAGCAECGDATECWRCLACHQVLCGRFVKAHMLEHHEKCGHALVLSYADLSVWCYKCEAYLDNPKLRPVKSAAHQAKFGEPLP